jgi:hypothetical protein
VAERTAAVRNSFGLYPFENLVEVGLGDMKGVMMTAATRCIEAGAAPCFRFVGESEGQAVVDLYLCEVADAGNRQAEDFRKELRGRHLILRGYNDVI